MTMATNMSHVVEFSDAFPSAAIVSTLSRQLSWSYFVNLLPLKRLDKHERQPGEEAPIGLPKQRWSKSCMQFCLRRVSGWRGAGCCWGTWMMRDDMKVSKGLEFPVVALPGVGHMPAKGEDEQEAARVFYVAATRATQRLVIGVGGDGGFGMKFG